MPFRGVGPFGFLNPVSRSLTMATESNFLPWHLQTTEPLTVTPVLGAFRAADDQPPTAEPLTCPEPPEGMLPLTFWVDGHPLASRWYGTEAYRPLRTSPLFAEPLRLVCLCTFPRTTPGWMHADVCAVGYSGGQVSSILDLSRRYPKAIPLVHAGYGRVAMPLGHHWVSIPDELRRALPNDTGDTRALAADFAARTVLWIVQGDDGEVAERLLRSIPGIRGERVES
jgi:hypothetical protein